MPRSKIYLSIIIPTYNAEQYIARCLTSVCAQTLSEIEILCIDDGSTDGTVDVVKSFSDDRIKFIANAHQGVSHARNVGIENARGDYVQFVDADDTLERNCCEFALNEALSKEADCVFFGTKLISDAAIPQWIIDCTDTGDRFYNKRSSDLLFKIRGTKPFVWNQIIRRSLLMKKNIRFDPSLILGEDQAFQFAYLPYARNVVLRKEPLYNHYVYPASTTFSIYDDMNAKVSLHLDVVRTVLKSAKRHDVDFRCKACIWAVDFLYNDIIHLQDERIKQKVSSVFKKHRCILYLIPPHLQTRAAEIGAINKTRNNFFSKVFRKLFYRY